MTYLAALLFPALSVTAALSVLISLVRFVAQIRREIAEARET